MDPTWQPLIELLKDATLATFVVLFVADIISPSSLRKKTEAQVEKLLTAIPALTSVVTDLTAAVAKLTQEHDVETSAHRQEIARLINETQALTTEIRLMRERERDK